jgi:FixJ family two-component response regulator
MTSDPAVFVIDDEAAMHEALKGLLGTWGIRAHVFLSAEAFLESYRDEWTGCVLADFRMPGLNGIAVLKELRNRGSSLSFILMTGHGNRELDQQALNAGIDAVLEKPFRVDQLKEFLARQCPHLFGGADSPSEG